MVGIAGVVVWLGYAVFAFGWSQVRGCNAGFLAMLSPFGTQPVCNADPAPSNVAPTSGKNVGTPASKGQKAVNEYVSKAMAEAAGANMGGQYAVVHNPNGSWSVLAP
jgi:uncharacterized membrane protein